MGCRQQTDYLPLRLTDSSASWTAAYWRNDPHHIGFVGIGAAEARAALAADTCMDAQASDINVVDCEFIHRLCVLLRGGATCAALYAGPG